MLHPNATPPEDENTSIWRYIDFPKFIDLVEHKSLFFSRANLLGDPFEGSVPKNNHVYWEEFKRRAEEQGLDAVNKLEDAIEEISTFRKTTVRTFFVNCWHMNETESAAMWSLYAPAGGAIAIKSRYNLLRACLPEYILISTVKYIDYDRDVIADQNVYAVMFHKRKSFEHERELRAVGWGLLGATAGGSEIKERTVTGGMRQEIVIEDLIEEVYVSPMAPDWVSTLVEDVLKRYDLTISVKKSSLNDPPSW